MFDLRRHFLWSCASFFIVW